MGGGEQQGERERAERARVDSMCMEEVCVSMETRLPIATARPSSGREACPGEARMQRGPVTNALNEMDFEMDNVLGKMSSHKMRLRSSERKS